MSQEKSNKEVGDNESVLNTILYQQEVILDKIGELPILHLMY